MSGGLKSNVIGGGTPTDLPATAGKVPVYAVGGLNARITDSIFAQGDSGNQVIVGSGASINAGQVAGTGVVAIGKGAVGWGQDAIGIGTSANAGQAAKWDGSITIGGASATGKNNIRIGSTLAFGGAFSDAVSIGTQTTAGGQNSVIIGTGSGAQVSSVAIGDTTSGGEPWAVAIGYHAACANSGNGTGSKCIAIGYQASAGVSAPGDLSAIAIGRNATAAGGDSIAIGSGASVSPNTAVHSIAIGHGAVVTTPNTMIIGDTTNGPINKFGIRTTAATPLSVAVGASGELAITDATFTTQFFKIDSSAVGGDIRMLVYDVTAAALKRVTLGAADSGGVGFKYLRVPN